MTDFNRRPPKGWDPRGNPEGCWMDEVKKPVDYTEGFRLFEEFDDAVAYASDLQFSVLSFDTEVDRWTVEPLAAFYG